jgi:hypothetical protein
MRRVLIIIALLSAAATLAACGGSKPAAAPGSADNPLTGKPQETKGGVRVGEPAPTNPDSSGGSRYETLVEGQSDAPRDQFTPCNLVTQRQARAIVGSQLEQPFEAPQGPTCIYRSRDGRTQVTLAVQTIDFKTIKHQVRGLRSITVGDRAGYCGYYGQPMLYVPLTGGRLLSIATPPKAPGAGQCGIGRDFAKLALPRL